MGKPRFEVADVFRAYGKDYRHRYRSSMSPQQRKVMDAIEMCRTAALGGHVDRCDQCGHEVISYNSCRNRHCPKCQNVDKALWREARRAEVLPVDYYHVVFTLPSELAPLALQNKKSLYGMLFSAASKTLLRIAADPKHLGVRLGITAVLHTWGQNLHHHPHLHCLVPGGGLSPDGKRWVSCKKGFFLPVRVLSRLFRRLFIAELQSAYDGGDLEFHGQLEALGNAEDFSALLKTCRRKEWVVYAKPPFAKPETVVDYLARYTHRIAISNHRLTGIDDDAVTFTYKDYKTGGTNKIMRLAPHEFMRRFLMHVLPPGFQRIRYYGFMANCHRKKKLVLCRQLLHVEPPDQPPDHVDQDRLTLFQALTGVDLSQCPHCHQGRLVHIRDLPGTGRRYRRSTQKARSP